MAKLEDIKQKAYPLYMKDDKTESLVFDFNSFALLEDKYNTVEDMFEVLQKGKIGSVRDLAWAGLSYKYMDEKTGEMAITPYEVGKMLATDKLSENMKNIVKALTAALPTEEQVDKELEDVLGK